MKLRNLLKFCVPLIPIILLASCSNNMQSVSVDSHGTTASAAVGNASQQVQQDKPASVDLSTAVITAAVGNSSLQIQDMGWGGSTGGHLWAVTRTSKGGGDYYLARCSNPNPANPASGFQWEVTNGQSGKPSHWGVRGSISPAGKFYHVNAAGALYWVKWYGPGTSSTYQQVSCPKINNVTLLAKDIGVGVVGNEEHLFGIFAESNGTKHVFSAYYSGTGSGSSDLWREEMVYSGSPVRVSADPQNGNNGVGVSSTNWTLLWDPDHHAFESPSFNDIAMCNGNWVYKLSTNNRLYKGYSPGSYSVTSKYGYHSVAMTKINETVYVMYINSANNFAFTTMDNL